MSSEYSTPQEISTFLSRLGRHPLGVHDMDGNTMQGYTLAPGKILTLATGDDPEARAIPSDISAAGIEDLANKGFLLRTVFAQKAMDARLPQAHVARLDRNIAAGEYFVSAFLTSRTAPDALTLLEASDVREPGMVTMVGDSGGTFCLKGKKYAVRPLSATETECLNGVKELVPQLAEAIGGIDASLSTNVYIEPKGVGINVHYRTILEAVGEKEGGALDLSLGAAFERILQDHAAKGPRNAAGEPAFEIVHGPMTVEMKLRDINKGHGLDAVVCAAFEAEDPITSVVFTGDDVVKGNGKPGTDYFAMIRAEEFSRKFRVPFYNIHTHHPAADGRPDPEKDPSRLGGGNLPTPRIDLRVATPAHLERVLEEVDRIRQAPRFPMTP